MSEPLLSLDLPALDGANPLGFLAALGTLVVLAEADPSIKLGWRSGARWTPFLTSHSPLEKVRVLQRLAERLPGKPVDAEKEKLRDARQEQCADAKARFRNAEKRLKERALHGNERDAAKKQDVLPKEEEFAGARDKWLAALRDAVPSLELALGDRPDCTIEEFRRCALVIREESKPSRRDAADLLVAFGAEVSNDPQKTIAPTPLCFVNGSGKQWFLSTARQLMTRKDPTEQDPSPPSCVTEERLGNCLFKHWTYSDEGLSMRWDPAEDVRYALRLDDPGPKGAYTVWMANLLAYVALVCFPCVPAARVSATACWVRDEEFRWPVWRMPLSADSVRSILTHRAFAVPDYQSDHKALRAELRARGVEAVFYARRVRVGNPPLHKINFSSTGAL